MRRFNRDILPGHREQDARARIDEPGEEPRPKEIVLDPASNDPQQMSSFVNTVMAELQRRDERIAELERQLEERSAELERRIDKAAQTGAGAPVSRQVGSEVTAILMAAEEAAERIRRQAEQDNDRLRVRVMTVVDEILRAQSSLGDMAAALARTISDDRR